MTQTHRSLVQANRDAGIKPIAHPFWENLPYANIYYSIAPDVLHQLYQGPLAKWRLMRGLDSFPLTTAFTYS